MSTVPKAKLLDINNTQLSVIKGSPGKDKERLPDKILLKNRDLEAKRILNTRSFNGSRDYPLYQYFEVIHENKYGHTISSEWIVMVHRVFEKLFEGVYLSDVDIKVVAYVFKNFIGYDEYYSAPAIIIRDKKHDVVDIVKYRPYREGYDRLPRYLQKNSEDKPKNRGDHFLYVFQVEMERLIKKDKYVFIGEGLKNALNALIRSIPYISIESASNTNNQKLITYLNTLHKQEIKIYGAMDGDIAGKKAFEEINSKLECTIWNLMDFNSNIDFTDYLRKEMI